MRVFIALFACAAFLSGCTTLEASRPEQFKAEAIVANPSSSDGQRSEAGALQPLAPYYTIGFRNWACNAAGGTITGENCFGQFRQELPAYIPTEVVLCKTEITVHELDNGTQEFKFRFYRFNNDPRGFFDYRIRAQSGIFGPGKSIKVSWLHYFVPVSQKDQTALKCDFKVEGGVP